MSEPLRVFGWLADMAGCAWYRIILPLGQLRATGQIEARWSGKIEEDTPENVDVIIAQRTCMAGPSWRWQKLAQMPNRPMLVLELDDDLMALTPDNPASRTYNDPQTRANLVQNIRVADLVTVSTPALAERISRFNQNVVVLPNCIPGELLAWQPGTYLDRFTVGWQGSPTHKADWKTAAEPIRRWYETASKATDGQVEFHTMGGVPDTFPEIRRHRHSGWEQDIAKYYLKLDWDVALAPLADTMFNRSKSDIRVVEAAALGFPAVASDVTAYHDSVVDGTTGFLVRKPSDWRRALDELLTNEDLRNRMANAAKQYARTRAVEANAHLWLEAYLAHR